MNKVLSIAHSSPAIHTYHVQQQQNFTSLILQHTIQTIYHTYPYIPYIHSTAHGLQFLHTGKTDHICHAQYSKYIVYCSHPQHNPHPMHINMHHTAFHNPLHTTNKQNGTSCRDGVKVLWCHSNLVCLVY